MSRKVLLADIENLSHQREAVGVHAAGLDRDHHVPCLLAGGIENFVLIDDTHRKARKVVLLVGHKTRVLGGLAANKSAARLNAALGYSRNDIRYLFGDILSAGDIVQEKLGLRAAAYDVVDAHRHAVDTHGVVPVHSESDLYFGTHAVGARDQNRFADTGHIKLEQTSETADTRQHAACHSPRHMGFHKLHSPVARGNVNARLLVAFGKTFHILLPFAVHGVSVRRLYIFIVS